MQEVLRIHNLVRAIYHDKINKFSQSYWNLLGKKIIISVLNNLRLTRNACTYTDSYICSFILLQFLRGARCVPFNTCLNGKLLLASQTLCAGDKRERWVNVLSSGDDSEIIVRKLELWSHLLISERMPLQSRGMDQNKIKFVRSRTVCTKSKKEHGKLEPN